MSSLDMPQKLYNIEKLSKELKKVTDSSNVNSLACRTGILESKLKCAIDGVGAKRLNHVEMLELFSVLGVKTEEVLNNIY